MPPEQATNTMREAVGVFQTAEQLEAAIDDLLSAGFDRAEVSLLAAEPAVEEKLGHKYRRPAELEARRRYRAGPMSRRKRSGMARAA